MHIANVSSLSCASAPLVIPGATQPFWSAGDEGADAGYPFSHPKDTTPPTIGSLSIQPKRFAVAKAATALSARKRRRAHQGATVRYTLSEPEKVTLVVEQTGKGRKKGHACVKAAKRLKHAPHCVLLRTKGTLTRTGSSGANQLAFSGRLGTRKLARGTYELLVSAVDSAGNRSAQQTVRFTIVKH